MKYKILRENVKEYIYIKTVHWVFRGRVIRKHNIYFVLVFLQRLFISTGIPKHGSPMFISHAVKVYLE